MVIDIWRTHQYYVLFAFALCYPLLFYKKLKFPLTILWMWCIFVTFKVGMQPFQGVQLWMSLLQGQLQSLVALFMLPTFILTLEEKHFAFVFRLLCTIIFANGLLAFAVGYGIFNVGTLDISVLALLSPFLANNIWEEKKPTASFICLGTLSIVCCFFGGSTSILSLLAALSGFLIIKDRRPWLIFVPASMVLLGWVSQRQELLNPNGRITAWQSYMHWWQDFVNKTSHPAFGLGLGSFEKLAPYANSGSNQTLLFLHNDYLQMLFEAGSIGIILMVVAIGFIAFRARHRADLFGACCGTLVCMFTYSPLHFAISQAFILCVVRQVLEKPRVK